MAENLLFSLIFTSNSVQLGRMSPQSIFHGSVNDDKKNDEKFCVKVNYIYVYSVIRRQAHVINAAIIAFNTCINISALFSVIRKTIMSMQ